MYSMAHLVYNARLTNILLKTIMTGGQILQWKYWVYQTDSKN